MPIKDLGKTVLREAGFLLSLALVTGLFGRLAVWRKEEIGPKTLELASFIFTVSGAIVALVLPGAELAGHLINKHIGYWNGELAGSANPAKTAIEANTFLNTVKSKAQLVKRGSVYVFIAFVASAGVLFAPATATFRSEPIYVGGWALGLSLSFLLVGSFLFFPFAFHVYNLKLLKGTIKMFEGIAAKVKDVPPTPPRDRKIEIVDGFWLGSMGQSDLTAAQTWVAKIDAVRDKSQTERLGTLQELGRLLFGSPQYQGLKRNDEDYLKNLYRAYLGREPDADGLLFWLGVLADHPETGRALVLHEFETCREFTEIVRKMPQ